MTFPGYSDYEIIGVIGSFMILVALIIGGWIP